MNVSVVIPLYNKKRHIRRALDSVLRQSFEVLEIIIVDDGSTDGGVNEVQGVIDSRVRMIVQENAGVSMARNRGISEARGELIAFLDADDEWHPDFIATSLALRERFPAAALWSTGYCLSSRGIVSPSRFHQLNRAGDPQGRLLHYFDDDSSWTAFVTPSVLIRRDQLQAVGGFPQGVVRGEDDDTWLRLALRFPIAWSPACRVTVYVDAENRTEHFNYIGNRPHFLSLRQYLTEVGPGANCLDKVYGFLARRHMPLLVTNWLGNNREAMREIVGDCRRIRGCRFRCFIWYLLSWVPHPLVIIAWKLKSLLSGQGGKIDRSRFRAIRRNV